MARGIAAAGSFKACLAPSPAGATPETGHNRLPHGPVPGGSLQGLTQPLAERALGEGVVVPGPAHQRLQDQLEVTQTGGEMGAEEATETDERQEGGRVEPGPREEPPRVHRPGLCPGRRALALCHRSTQSPVLSVAQAGPRGAERAHMQALPVISLGQRRWPQGAQFPVLQARPQPGRPGVWGPTQQISLPVGEATSTEQGSSGISCWTPARSP